MQRPCSSEQGLCRLIIILAVTDDGSLKLTSYRRVILHVHPVSSRK
jgi:cellulose-binding protein